MVVLRARYLSRFSGSFSRSPVWVPGVRIAGPVRRPWPSAEGGDDLPAEPLKALQLRLEARPVGLTEGHDEVIHVELVLDLLDLLDAVLRAADDQAIDVVAIEH